MRRLTAAVSFLLGLGLVSSPAVASAATITFQFDLVVTSLDAGVLDAFPTLAVGDTIVGQVTFDDQATDLNAAPAFGRFDYVAAAAALSFDVDGETFGFTGSRIETFDGAIDFYRVLDHGTLVDHPVVLAADFFANMVGPASMLAGPALPLSPPNAALFTSAPFSLFVETQQGGGNILGTVTSLSADSPVTPVPEPATMALLGTGLAALARRRRRARRP